MYTLICHCVGTVLHESIKMKILILCKFLFAICLLSGKASGLLKNKVRMDCTECLEEMQGLGALVKMGAKNIEV